jgi:Dinucleotide-utilizing enzymes involved in molybdopterin and thiamine biosynthesis family 1
MSSGQTIFSRTELLLGEELMERISSAKVIVFGVGGVGSWCAESLVRSGIRYLTIVDFDRVCVTNINRQLMATTRTVGQAKVDVLKIRLLEINPDAEITAIQEMYSADNSSLFNIASYDYVVDAIDSLKSKTELILETTRTKAKLFSSMGAALKTDPSKISVAEFWKVRGCPLAAALRRKMKKGDMPAKKFLCVYSEELFENRGDDHDSQELVSQDSGYKKAITNGSLAHTTAIFGFTLAGLIIQDIINSKTCP